MHHLILFLVALLYWELIGPRVAMATSTDGVASPVACFVTLHLFI